MDLSLKRIDNTNSSCFCKYVNYAQEIKYMLWGKKLTLKALYYVAENGC